MKVWIGVLSFDVKCATTLKGLSVLIGGNYGTMKRKGENGGPFVVKVGKGSEERGWFCVRVEAVKVHGRGGNGKIGKGGFNVIE